ncbi:Protein of unknown function (DUF1162) [Abeliophyllum distichum]|uniref:Vacuolar protein sorting-associated protein 13 VPS13 adaptor binding domain-containing protein n=1 Tax=Abeliophyllum distichum TaxID=126358 RepID=A0ABD1SJ12_9LAMI
MHEMPSHGIYISGPKLFMDVSFKGGNMDVIIDLSGFRSIIFRYPADFEESLNKSEINNLLCSLNFLIEASISHIKLCFFLRTLKKAFPRASLSTAIDEPNSNGNALRMVGHSPLFMNTELLGDHPVVATIAISEIYVSSCPVKNVLAREHKPNKLNASFSVGEEFQTISCDSKGGFLLLEATSVTMFAECCTSYYNRILNLWPAGSSPGGVVPQYSEDETVLDVHSSMDLGQLQHVTLDRLEEFSLNISHLFLTFVSSDESGRLQELLLEVDFHLNHKVMSTVKKISLGVSKFSMLSQCIHVMGQKPRDIQIHGFSSGTLDDSSPDSISEGSSVLEQKDTANSVLADTSRSSPSTSQNDIYIGSAGGSVTREQKSVHLSFQNYILKEFKSSLAAEWPVSGDQICPNKLWVGNGSISGFDLTISLTEIKIIISAFASFSEVFIREKTAKVEQRHWSKNQDSEESTEEMVADGTIVAIQDVDQHMYIAVEDVESRYGIVGATHYSLVGERSLFRVKYHNARRWNSQVQYFSLISLYAKDSSGESLRLNCLPRLGFVDISCSNDSGCALWAAVPFRPDHYGDDVELESFRPLVRRTFYLVNKKNDYAVAFIDGVLEFVSKPGNLFKWKVFRDPSPASNSLLPIRYLGMASGANLQNDSNVNDTRELRENGKLSGITITIDKVTLTILHELSDIQEKFPLLQGSITSTEINLQISNTKARVMNTLGVVLYYFDAQRSSWREFLHPLEICSFYSSKFLIPGSDNVLHRVQSHFYARIKEATVSVNELSLDIILFVIGKLNLAGPYALNSVVLANCCKVENQSGLTVLCQFYDNQEASVSSRQSTTIFLRHLALANQHPEASLFSIQLSRGDLLSTSPIHLSLLEAQKFAWRTRIVSSQDSKSFPGPFIVVEISRGIEDGLSISVSPLLKIHNDTDFSLELRFQRPQHKETDSATLVLKAGDVLDDSMAAFGATDLSGGLKKALTSLSVGNFIFSFRPDIATSMKFFKNETAEWSDELKGGKPVSLSGVFDKLSYRVRKAFSVESEKFSLSTAHCALKSEGGHISEIHFLIQSVRKDVPVMRPDNFGYAPANKNLPVALQEQKEIFLLPTVHVSNLLHTEIHVNLTDGDPLATMDHGDAWSCATIPSGSAVNLYANPATIYFTVTLTSFGSSCKPVNSKDWVRKLQKQKSDVYHLDIELDFGGGKYFAILRLSRGHRGVLEAAVFTTYAVENDTDTPLLCFPANQKPLVRYEVEMASDIPPDLGSYLPPKSIKSWFMKPHKVCLKLLEEKASEAQLDLDALSGLTEIDLEVEENFGLKNITRLGVSLRPSVSKVVSTQMVSLNPRYVVSNESEEAITIRQCYLEDDMEGLIAINSKERIPLRLKGGTGRKRETNAINNFLRKHTKSLDDTLLFIQFRPTEAGLGWSGPVCVASLGRFFLKFRRSSEYSEGQSDSMSCKQNLYEFAAVNVVEGGSTIVLHFQRSLTTNLPYRIENYLRHAPITYYQKGSSEPEILGVGHSVNYVWDDLTLPHKLVVQLDDLHVLCEINLDKVRAWKPLSRTKQNRGLGFPLPVDKKPEDQKRTTYSKLIGTETVKLGYEVYADGVTRVLRICEFSDSHKVDAVFQTGTKTRLRISNFAIHLLGHAKQEMDLGEPSNYAPIITTRLDNINWDSMFTDRHKYNQIRVKSLSVDEKWTGAPFAAMLRRHRSENSDSNECILRVIIVLVSSNSRIKQVKCLSIVLQPLDLNLDEETLMKIVPFWRTSLSDSNTPSQQYYFDHFEIHPIKVVGSFLPGDSYSSYSSTQETLRSLLHSVIKVPAIKNMTIELNGVLVTHALITLRELTIKCAQHYSWYAMRAIYIAKGSPLLPPSFTSIFDDLASSSLDVFFDPSRGLPNLPGVTLGTLKLISKFVNDKGFSGTKRYFGDLGKTLKMAGSNILFAAVTEISDSVLKGAETNGFPGMASGFRHGILKLAMEPSLLGSAFMEGGPDRKIKLDRSPGVDELYIEGYLQAMLDTMYKQEYLRVRVIENQVVLKNLPPNSALIEEITERLKSFLVSKSLLKGESSKEAHSLRHIRGESEWRIGPTVLTLCEHLFVSFAIRMLRKQAGKVIAKIKWQGKLKADDAKAIVPASSGEESKVKIVWKWGIGKFVLSGIVAYVDGRLCRNIPNPVARRIVSGFLLSFLDKNDE